MHMITWKTSISRYWLWPIALLLCACNGSGSLAVSGDNYSINVSRPSSDFESVSGTITLSAEVSSENTIVRVEFHINGELIGSDSNAPYRYDWNTLGYADGSYRLVIYQVDTEGNTQASQPRIINVSNQATANLGCSPSTTDSALLNAHNIARANARYCGNDYYEASNPLQWNCSLRLSASTHAQDMAVNNFFNHEGSDGSRIGERAHSAGYNYQIVGENIAAGQTSITQVMNEWLESPGHCRNIMETRYTDLGAIKLSSTNPNSDYSLYWTTNFGAEQNTE